MKRRLSGNVNVRMKAQVHPQCGSRYEDFNRKIYTALRDIPGTLKAEDADEHDRPDQADDAEEGAKVAPEVGRSGTSHGIRRRSRPSRSWTTSSASSGRSGAIHTSPSSCETMSRFLQQNCADEESEVPVEGSKPVRKRWR